MRFRAHALSLAGLLFVLACATAISESESGSESGIDKPAVPSARGRDRWEEAYQGRLQWWSLQPLATASAPVNADPGWARSDLDRFILAALEAKGLKPSTEADRGVLARRLAFALTGLPPDPEAAARLMADASEDAYRRYVGSLLASPHFGERWARHWLDVVHYADTHGYEWDTPAKNAWRYRDSVIRAFNADVPIRRFLLEQIAGDLVEPRVEDASGLNESLLGTMALRLGERRHGDNAAAEGVTQEAMANVVDTVGKGFLATTIACAQCHDHKLDAVEQQDFYAMCGVFMSTRWVARTADAVDPNGGIVAELRAIKRSIRAELSRAWSGRISSIPTRLHALPPPPTNSPATGFPETLTALWHRVRTNPPTMAEFQRERARRMEDNRTHLTLLADFSRDDAAPGWRWDGFGMEHGLVRDGEPVIAESGEAVLRHVLPAGRWSHVWSTRLAGALRSPLLESQPPLVFSVEIVGGGFAAESFIIDHAFHSERMQFLNLARPAWRSLKAGGFDTLEGGVDSGNRRVYVEWVTKSLNNYFPPRTGYGGVKESDLADESSWFGVSRIQRHPAGKGPRDELERFVAIFNDAAEGDDLDAWARRITEGIAAAVERWSRDASIAEDVRMLNDALASGLLANTAPPGSELADQVERYRRKVGELRSDRTIGSVADWEEGRDERIGVRGSYTTLGAEAPRGNIRFLGGPQPRSEVPASGRLELAKSIADDRNPLTARVFVNRVWLHLFGEGLVRTPDDFGHLGEKPSHPELLDALAASFIADGWSLKKLIARIVTSSTWRQDNLPAPASLEIDPENRLWHHMPLRRLDAESIRDSILAASGRLDPALYGPPIDPPRSGEDAAKRLFSGPLDGDGRRSLYLKMTLMEPPRFLALFNQPIPKMTTGRRDVTSVPDQALALLNDPFVVAMARHWSERVLADGSVTTDQRVRRMAARALSREYADDETARLVGLAFTTARLRGGAAEDDAALLTCQPVWQDVAHALFNLKEFIHVR